MSEFHDTSVLKEACDRLTEGMDLTDRIRTLETHNAALREVAIAAAEYLDMLPRTFGGARELAAKLRAVVEKCNDAR